MRLAERFSFAGTYRVQSAVRGLPSRLEGRWIEPGHGDADSALVNCHLFAHPLWIGGQEVTLRPALVSKREGAFGNEPDILYKLSNFAPAPGCVGMTTNVVDVAKARLNWRSRAPHVRALLGSETVEQVHELIGPIETVVANEYFVHEAGHCLGYPTDRKYAQGYFRPAGQLLWPLVHLEEFRADLLSFGIAVDALPRERAVATFLYNVLLRLGVHVEAKSAVEEAPYGPIPHLLITLLQEIGWVEIEQTQGVLHLGSLRTNDILQVMRTCSAHAASSLVEPELNCVSPIDAALVAARYFRRRMGAASVDAFEEVSVRSAARVGRGLANEHVVHRRSRCRPRTSNSSRRLGGIRLKAAT